MGAEIFLPDIRKILLRTFSRQSFITHYSTVIMPPRKATKRKTTSKEVEGDVGSPVKKQASKGKVFKRKALALVEDMRSEFGDFEVELNPSAPRRGSFEIVLLRDGKDDEEVWTGLKKGPPRKQKFPDPEVLIEAVKKMLK